VAIALKLAEQERARLIKRTREGLETRKRWLREKGSYVKTVRDRGGKERSWTVTALGRSRVVIPDRAVLKAAEIREVSGDSWRTIARELSRLGLGTWSHTTLARECTKRVSGLRRGEAGWPRGSR
jgi:hypothetical protein